MLLYTIIAVTYHNRQLWQLLYLRVVKLDSQTHIIKHIVHNHLHPEPSPHHRHAHGVPLELSNLYQVQLSWAHCYPILKILMEPSVSMANLDLVMI